MINLLKEVNENICPIEFLRGREVYFSIYRKPHKFANKGLRTPSEIFRSRSGNYILDGSLFLYINDEVEYYWHEDIEKVLEEIIRGDKQYLLNLSSNE